MHYNSRHDRLLNPRAPAPSRRRPSREKLETLGTLSLRASVGHGARGLFSRRGLLELFPARSCPLPRLSLGRRWIAGVLRSRMPALLRAGAVERQGSDSQGAILWPE